ncbi:hydrolase [bacterium]|nr:hydrolase [bacterium]
MLELKSFIQSLTCSLLLYCQPQDPKPHPKDQFIIWDVGQGQWTTLVSQKDCEHFDMGGERFPKPVLKICRRKINRLYISHWDLDHVGLIRKSQKKGLRLCVAALPTAASTKNLSIEKQILSIKKCEASSEVYTPSMVFSKSNENSQSFFVRKKILITGDTPSHLEGNIYFRSPLTKTSALVVGHHGSYTSTSIEFLKKLRSLKMAFVSARYKKYGHPHPTTTKKFKQMRVPLIKTEDWGNLVVEVSSEE